MNYALLRELIGEVEAFESRELNQNYSNDVYGFGKWLYESRIQPRTVAEPDWEGKEKGRTAESVISTLLVHLNRYAKLYSKSAMYDSEFSTQEEFIYLINLNAFGPMTKMQLIKKNIQEKPAGMQIINRLVKQGWVVQTDGTDDKRSRVIALTKKGSTTLERQMQKIRQATQVVTGDLTYAEKMELIRLLDKLDRFHHPIYCTNLGPGKLLNHAFSNQESEKGLGL